MTGEADLLEAAAAAGVPVPGGRRRSASGLDPGWLVVEHLEGESIPRKLLRDPEWATPAASLTGQCGAAFAAIHASTPTPSGACRHHDPLADPLPSSTGSARSDPRWSSGRWLASTDPRPIAGDGARRFPDGQPARRASGLRAVLDWELAHAGDPAEDIGWLCSRAWRFGGAGRSAVSDTLPELLDSYASAGGVPSTRPDPVVGGLRRGQVGGDLRAPGLCPSARGHPLHGAGGHRPAGL